MVNYFLVPTVMVIKPANIAVAKRKVAKGNVRNLMNAFAHMNAREVFARQLLLLYLPTRHVQPRSFLLPTLAYALCSKTIPCGRIIMIMPTNWQY
jgi:hypothetical protein